MAQDSADAGKIRLAFQLLDNVEWQVRAADQKVSALFGANTLFAAALALINTTLLSKFSADSSNPLRTVQIAASGVMILAVGFAAVSAIMALLPRIRTMAPERSSLFFAHIAAMDQSEFINEFLKLSDQDAVRQILSQVHANACIVDVKYKWTRRSATALIVAILIWLMIQLVSFVG